MSQTTSQYNIVDGRLVLSNGREVSFPYPVAESLNFPHAIVVRLDVPPKAHFNENVFGISYDGKILWQVLPQQHVREESPYTSISYEGSKAGLYNWDATLYVVEPTTGKVVDKQFLK